MGFLEFLGLGRTKEKVQFEQRSVPPQSSVGKPGLEFAAHGTFPSSPFELPDTR